MTLRAASRAVLAVLFSQAVGCAHAARPETAAMPVTSSWTDPSPHVAGFVEADGVRLHYLDWGGTGDTVVLLSGLGDSAHVFDDFAPHLTDQFRVVGLTRRGFGESSQPASGYDTATLAEDVRRLLDHLGVERAHLIGHSLAGSEMSRFAASHPDRVGGLVYLDAAFDRVSLKRRLIVSMILGQGPPVPPRAGGRDRASPAAYASYLSRTKGVRIPEADVRATRVFDAGARYRGDRAPGSVVRKVILGEERPPYEAIEAPALALYADVSPDHTSPWLAKWEPDRLKAARYTRQVWAPYVHGQVQLFDRKVAQGHSRFVTGGRHYLFLSHPEEVREEVRRFLTNSIVGPASAGGSGSAPGAPGSQSLSRVD